jgi:hypothetical protein
MQSFMSDLQRLEDEAVMQEGRLLAKGQSEDLPFNFTSYVARVPLEAAFAALARAGDQYQLVVPGEDARAASEAAGQRASMGLHQVRRGSWQLVVEQEVATAAEARDDEVLLQVRGRPWRPWRWRWRCLRARRPPACLALLGSGALRFCSAGAACAAAAMLRLGRCSCRHPALARPPAPSPRPAPPACAPQVDAGDMRDGSARTPLFRLPGLTLCLRTSAGFVDFTPAFLSVEQLATFLDTAKSGACRLHLAQQRERRRQWCQAIETLATVVAGLGGGGGAAAGSGAKGQEEEEEDDGLGEPPEAKQLLEELGERGGAGAGGAHGPPQGLLRVVGGPAPVPALRPPLSCAAGPECGAGCAAATEGGGCRGL